MRDRWLLVVVATLLLAISVFTTLTLVHRNLDSSLETVVVPGVHSISVAVSMQGYAECVRVIGRLA
jgi:precorrin-2 methylase